MKKVLSAFILLFISSISYAQKMPTGSSDGGLKLAYDYKTNKVTGYFENYTGWDETAKAPRFSCIFYIEGSVVGNKFKIKTYYPSGQADDMIEGTLEVTDSKTVAIKLPEDHGGCWNVQHFADEPAKFTLTETKTWTQIRYITAGKTYFYSERLPDKKRKAYLVKSNFVCVDKVDSGWVYCTYYGKTATSGWIRESDLNKL